MADPKVVGNNKKKMGVSSSFDELPDSKRHCSSLPTHPTRSEAGSVAKSEGYYVELMFGKMKPLLAELIQAEVEKAFRSRFLNDVESLWDRKEMGEEVKKEDEKDQKYKLVFFNEPTSIIFTNNEIKAENGEALTVAIVDATTNAVVSIGPLSSARVEFFLLDGDYGTSGQGYLALSPRDGKRPLMVGEDLKLTLQNGVGYLHSLSITDNSSWIKSKKFRLGVKIIGNNQNLAMFVKIGMAVSQPFRVMDHRGEVNKKHHPPSREDEVWRLEGIGKDGAYHKNLSHHGILNVGDFLKTYEEMGSTSFKKLLGNKVPKKTWEMMVSNAKECLSVDLPNYEHSSKVNLFEYKAIGDEPPLNQAFKGYEQESIPNLGHESPQMPEMDLDVKDFGYELGFGDFSSLFTGEAFTSSAIKD